MSKKETLEKAGNLESDGKIWESELGVKLIEFIFNMYISLNPLAN